jgi:predicted nucleic acid-binding protein
VITAIDTSVLLDVLGPDPVFGARSAQALRDAIAQGSLIACEVVWAEVGGRFAQAGDATRVLERLTVAYSAIHATEALEAGRAWQTYRARGGTRERVIADFLVGAHATARADRLLTRDRGFFRTYFEDLAVVDPGSA